MQPIQGPISLSFADLVVSAGLILVTGVISLYLGLGLEKKLAIASIRTVVQLLVVGFVLEAVFQIKTPYVLGLVLAVMIGFAGRAAVGRASRFYRGAYIRSIFSVAITAMATTLVVTQVVIGVEPWYQPQYVIPLLGMTLGNTLTGISLCLDHLLEQFDRDRNLVEMELSLGATGWEACHRPFKDAIQRGMIPILNAMMVVAIVSLPGMMTGQILAGADPVEAVKYQMVVMFMLACSTALGAILVAYLTFRALVNDRHQLLTRRITKLRQEDTRSTQRRVRA